MNILNLDTYWPRVHHEMGLERRDTVPPDFRGSEINQVYNNISVTMTVKYDFYFYFVFILVYLSHPIRINIALFGFFYLEDYIYNKCNTNTV